jgi:hypothetical protein
MKRFSQRWMPRFLNSVQITARVEASKEVLWILQGSEANTFKGIATGDESWFRYSYQSSKMFTRLPTDVIPRTRQTIDAKRTVITLFFTTMKLIVLDILPKGHKYNQKYIVDYIVPDFEMANMRFQRRIPESTFECRWTIQYVTTDPR